jgi:hypothetical protein
MKIKDLFSSNKVAGEGIIKWNVIDSSGATVTLQMPGFHIPGVKVCLLSSQVLLQLVGGQSVQMVDSICISSGNEILLDARYCPRSNLPFLKMGVNGKHPRSFWSNAFAYTANEAKTYPTLIDAANVNLSASQKEVLLWHQRLSHASISWIQHLMHNRKWHQDHDLLTSLHLGPFIPCKNACSLNCNISTLKCAACLCAKASTCSPTTKPSCKHTRDHIFQDEINGNQEQILKRGHTQCGDCVLVDQYVSTVQGRLPHTFGRERHRYTCGTLFVDQASGKIFNFCQLSNNAAKTIKSKSCSETIAQNNSFNIKAHHMDNEIFASAAFKNDCTSHSVL